MGGMGLWSKREEGEQEREERRAAEERETM